MIKSESKEIGHNIKYKRIKEKGKDKMWMK